MKMLSRSEEIILLAILQLGDNAYGISIRELIHTSTGVEWSLAQIYDPLNRLNHKGYVSKYRGDPSSERGGRHKCLYSLTREGKEALRELQRVQKNLWEKLPKKALS
ncbi:MAG: PadR family transcriptional regulator [Candidatus Aminicenantaceae bacterium]